MATGNIVTWGALNARVSLFTSAFDAARADETYLLAFDVAASSYQNVPAGMPFAPAVASGIEKIGQLSIQKYPGRVDLVLVPIATQTVASSPLMYLSDPNDALDRVQRAAAKLTRSEHSLARIALGAEFAKISDTVTNANKVLLDVLPFSVPLKDQMDFTLQFAVRSNSKSIENIKINNLMRWSVTQAQQMMIPAYGTSTQSLAPASVFYMSQFVADVNTAPEGRPVAGSDVRAILSDLRDKVNQSRHGRWEGETWNE